MKTLTDETCSRCGCTTSYLWLKSVDGLHVCPDGSRPEGTITVTERVVPGPGERLADIEKEGEL